MLATFGGKDVPAASGAVFENTSYRSQVAFGFGERSVLAGDDKGALWVWDLVSVSGRSMQVERACGKVPNVDPIGMPSPSPCVCVNVVDP